MAVHIPTVSVPCEACRTHGSLPSTAASARASRPPRCTRRKRNEVRNLRNRRRVTSERDYRAQRPQCHMCTLDRQRPPSTGGQIPRPWKRLERHTEWPSIVPAGHMDRSISSISTIRWRQA